MLTSTPSRKKQKLVNETELSLTPFNEEASVESHSCISSLYSTLQLNDYSVHNESSGVWLEETFESV